MPQFPNGFPAKPPSLSFKLLADDGAANNSNGTVTVQQVLDLLDLGHLPAGNAAGQTFRWNGTAWEFGSDSNDAALAAAAALTDTDVFGVNQGGAADAKSTLAALYTYVHNKFLVSQATVLDITGTSYTLLNADVNKILRFTSNSPVTVNCSSKTPGYMVQWVQQGTGQLTFAANGMTLQSFAGFKSAGQYARGSVACIASNTFNLSGATVV